MRLFIVLEAGASMNQHELRRWAAAYYFYVGWSGEKIATKLGLNPGNVARLLAEARDERYVVTTFDARRAPWEELQRLLQPWAINDDPKFTLEDVLQSAELVSKLSNKSFAQELQERTKAKNLRRVIVCDSNCPKNELREEDSRSWPDRIQAFGHAAAPHVNAIAEDSKIVGVVWGSTLAAVVEELFAQRKAAHTRPRKQRLRSVALVGDDFGTDELATAPSIGQKEREALERNIWRAEDRAETISASYVALRLKEALDHQHGIVHRLRGIPALLPFSFKDEAAVKTARDGLLGFPNYARVFGKDGLVSQLDTVFASVGTIDQKNKFYLPVLRNGGYTEEQMENLGRYGDIGGALFPLVEPVPQEAMNVASVVMSRWTGMQLEDYRRIARQFGPKEDLAVQDSKSNGHRTLPGVVVLALGWNKRKAVMRCLKEDLCNILLIDDSLALGLLDDATYR